MSELVSHDQIHQLFLTYGVWAVAIIVGLESMGLPLPGEAALIAAATYVGTHDGSLTGVIVAATVGAIVGDNIGYLAGRYLGHPFLARFGRYVGLTEDRLRLGRYLFAQYGVGIVFLGRFIAVLRVLAAFLAGANRMTWTHFLLANAAGALLWAGGVGTAAYFLGSQLHGIHGRLSAIGIVLAVAAVAAGVYYLRRHEAALQAKADRMTLEP